MKVIKRKNQEIYKYVKHDFSDGIRVSIMFFLLALIFFAVGILISYMNNGEGGTIIAGFAISSIICDVSSLIYVIREIYKFRNFHSEVRNLMVLTVLFLVMWIIIV